VVLESKYQCLLSRPRLSKLFYGKSFPTFLISFASFLIVLNNSIGLFIRIFGRFGNSISGKFLLSSIKLSLIELVDSFSGGSHLLVSRSYLKVIFLCFKSFNSLSVVFNCVKAKLLTSKIT